MQQFPFGQRRVREFTKPVDTPDHVLNAKAFKPTFPVKNAAKRQFIGLILIGKCCNWLPKTEASRTLTGLTSTTHLIETNVI